MKISYIQFIQGFDKIVHVFAAQMYTVKSMHGIDIDQGMHLLLIVFIGILNDINVT